MSLFKLLLTHGVPLNVARNAVVGLTKVAILFAIPTITTFLFWSKLREMELNQIVVTRKDTAS